MLKLKSIALSLIFILLFFFSADAEVITLKSGKVVEGEITEICKDYLKVKQNGSEIYYENKYIKNIENGGPDALSMILQKEKPDEDISLFLKKGIESASQGKFGEARREFEKQLKDIKGCLGILDDAEKGAISKECAIYLFQGSLHIIDEEYDLAATSFEKAWGINPKDADVNYNLGLVYYVQEEYEKAVAFLVASLKLKPDAAEVHKLLAKAYYNLKEYRKSRENLLIARELFKKQNDEDGVAATNCILKFSKFR